MLRRSFPQSLRLIEEDDRPQRTFGELKQRARSGFAGGAKIRWRLPGGSAQVSLLRRGERPFGQRQERRANDGSDRALGARVKFADRFDGVTEQLDRSEERRVGKECRARSGT